MPIRVTCSCGYTANVPDEMAGKSGRCPKCKATLKIPGPAAATPAAVAQAGKPKSQAPTKSSKQTAPLQTAAPSKATQPPAAGALDSLYADVGLIQNKGPVCPSCTAPIVPNSVLCVKCGFHFSEEHQLESTQGFGNIHLNEAAVMMERERQTEKQLNSAGSPWWMMLSILVGISVMIIGLSIKQHAVTTEKTSSIEALRRIQEAGYLPVLAASFGLAMLLTANFANLAILVVAFKESAKHGLMYFFVPFYSLYYMFSRIKEKRLVSTVVILLVTGTLGAIALGYALPKI
jgi:predicted Zn-ribbon and HTH transcriptional regulator